MIALNKDSQACRDLRHRIQAHRIKRLKWSDFVFHYIMKGLGYGESLRELDEEQLKALWAIIRDYRRAPETAYDRAGRYMYSLQKRAGWSDLQIRQFMTINYSKTHWNILNAQERKDMINILKQVVKDQEDR